MVPDEGSDVLSLPIQDVPQAASTDDVEVSASFADIVSDLINHSAVIDSEDAELAVEDALPEMWSSEEVPLGSFARHIPIPLKQLFDYTLPSEINKGLKFHWHIGEGLLRLEEDMFSPDSNVQQTN